MSAELLIQVCIWFLQALVSSVTGQGVTVESCHLLPLSNPSPPIICSSPPSLLLADAVRTTIRAKLLSSRVLRPGAGREAHALLCWTRTPERARKQEPWEWSERMDGRIEGLPISLFLLYSTGLYHNPGRIKPLLPPTHPIISPSIHPSLPLSLSLTLTVSGSLALIFSRSLPDLLSLLLFFLCFFSTLVLRTPSCFFFPN